MDERKLQRRLRSLMIASVFGLTFLIGGEEVRESFMPSSTESTVKTLYVVLLVTVGLLFYLLEHFQDKWGWSEFELKEAPFAKSAVAALGMVVTYSLLVGLTYIPENGADNLRAFPQAFVFLLIDYYFLFAVAIWLLICVALYSFVPESWKKLTIGDLMTKKTKRALLFQKGIAVVLLGFLILMILVTLLVIAYAWYLESGPG